MREGLSPPSTLSQPPRRFTITTTRYSKNKIEKRIENNTYSSYKLSAIEVNREGFKILKAIMGGVGVGIDAMMQEDTVYLNNTVAGMLQLISENLTVEHYDDLICKLFGCLQFNGVDVLDWGEHFDDHEEDLLEVIGWLGLETFKGFFMKSTILKPWVTKMREVVLPQVSQKMNNAFSNNETELNEELCEKG